VRTFSPKASEVTRAWHIIDANEVPLGRIASVAATILRGKHKAIFAPHVDTGDFVIVINAGKVALSGSKRVQKKAFTYSGFPGGLTSIGYDKLLETNPKRNSPSSATSSQTKSPPTCKPTRKWTSADAASSAN